ncbi:TonB-dependent receptor [Halioxenophilus aromaticivorans]
MHINLKQKQLPWLLATVFMAGSSAVAAETSGQMEEVILTATKRGDAGIQDIPFAVQALGGEALESMGAADFGDFFRMVPGLAVFDQGPGDKRYIIRGVNSTGAGTVGLYMDEVIITGENAQDGGGRQPDLKLFDIDRVEVLKGPQGTTFGSSSLSGTIRYITKKPDFEGPSADVTFGLRSTDGADLGHEIEVAGNLPLIDDVLAVRVAGYKLAREGFIDNQIADDVNDEDTSAGRVSLLYTPTDRLSIYAMAMNQDSETGGPSYYHENDYLGNALREYAQADLTKNGFEDDMSLYNLTADYDLDVGTITATTSKLKRDTRFSRDTSFYLDYVFGWDYLTEGRSVITQPKAREVDSYELRFASDFSDPFQVLVGGFKQSEERFFRSSIVQANASGVMMSDGYYSLDRTVATEVEESALFAELSYDLTDKITVTAGARWFDYEYDEQGISLQGASGGAGSGPGPVLSFEEDDIIGKFNLSYQINEDHMAYFQWAQGFRSGGANDQTAAQLAGVTIPAGYGSDSLNNFEVGFKDTFLNGALVLNTAVYYIDWSDIQIQDQATDGVLSFPYRGNGGAAEIYGFEFDATAYPMDGLSLTFSGSLLQAELSEDNPIPSSGVDGDKIPYTPETTFSLSGRYEWAVGTSTMLGFVGGDLAYVGERQTELRPDSSTYLELDSYALANLRAGVEDDSWSASLSVNNVFNDDTVTDVFRTIPGVYPDGYLFNNPRTLILSFKKSFY